ncbi:hypothetical protein HDU76_011183, partial [Blyttiomyces sp. JEL0837]
MAKEGKGQHSVGAGGSTTGSTPSSDDSKKEEKTPPPPPPQEEQQIVPRQDLSMDASQSTPNPDPQQTS